MAPNDKLSDLEDKIGRMAAQMQSMYNVVIGLRDHDDKPIAGMPKGMAERMHAVEQELEDIQSNLRVVKNLWKWILIAVAIGFILGAVALGWLTLQQAGEGIKKVVE